MPRHSEIPADRLTEAQRRVVDALVAGKRGRVPAPFQALLRSPELCQRAQALGEYCRYDTVLEPRLSELAIIVTARFWTAQYEWHAHAPHAEKMGLSPEIVRAVAENRDATALMKPDEKVVYAFARQLHEKHAVDDATYSEAEKLFGARGVADLVGVIGYYTLVSMVLNTFEVPVPGGGTPLK